MEVDLADAAPAAATPRRSMRVAGVATAASTSSPPTASTLLSSSAAPSRPPPAHAATLGKSSSLADTAPIRHTGFVTTARPSTTSQSALPAGKLVADYYQWPVFFAILPPILSLYYGGKSEEWSEGFTLVVVSFYLYGLIKLPWELYVAAKQRTASAANRVALVYSQSEERLTETEQAAALVRHKSAVRLRRLEYFYLALVFASPLGGAIFIRYIRPHLQLYQNLINSFPMALYVLTAYIRPLIHLSRMLKQHAANLHDEIHYPSGEIYELRGRVAALEEQLGVLRAGAVDSVGDDAGVKLQFALESKVEPHLKGLSKDLQRTIRKEKKFMDYSMERFRELSIKVQHQEALISHLQQSHTVSTVAESRHRHHKVVQPHRSFLLWPAYWMLETLPTLPMRAILVPVNAFLRLSAWILPGAVSRLLPSLPLSPNKTRVVEYDVDDDRGRPVSPLSPGVRGPMFYLKAGSDRSRSGSNSPPHNNAANNSMPPLSPTPVGDNSHRRHGSHGRF